MHGLQCFSSTDSEGSESLLLILKAISSNIIIFRTKFGHFLFSLDKQVLEFRSFASDTRTLTLNVLYHTTPHHSPGPQDPCTTSYFRYFEGSDSFTSILCLPVKIDMRKIKYQLSHNRTGVGTLIFFNKT